MAFAGCSVLYDLSADQCEIDADCRALAIGAKDTCFEGQCIEAVADSTNTNSGGMGGSTSTNGEGGIGGEPECATNEDCIEAKYDEPFICRDGQCISLIDPNRECPVVLGGTEQPSYPNLRTENPIIFGAYSLIGGGSDLELSNPTLNYKLAIEEVNGRLGGEVGNRGLKVRQDEDRRPFVAVICDGVTGDIDASMDHLVNTLKVPGIIASLYTNDLLNAFENYALPSRTFMLSPLEADTLLLTGDENDLMWHLLGSAEDLARGYIPLLARTEAYFNDVVHADLDPKPDLKLAIIDSDVPFLQDIYNHVIRYGSINGVDLTDADEDTFMQFHLEAQATQGDIDEIGDALFDWGPDIVLLLTTDEVMVYDLPFAVERYGPGFTGPHGELPFYLLSPYLFTPNTVMTASGSINDLKGRMLGINFAAAEDKTVYDLYLDRLENRFSDAPFGLDGQENFYDAAYYLMYGIAAGLSGNPGNFGGIHIAQNFERIITPGGDLREVGPVDVQRAMPGLVSDPEQRIELQGTLGPPDFNFSTGARKSLPSAYCVHPDEDAGNTLVLTSDVMTFDDDSDTFSADPPPCVPDF